MSTLPDRSQSRGREAFVATGRGGIGNIRQSSNSRPPSDTPRSDTTSVLRGREPVQKAYSTGRGGAGNIRSSTTSPDAKVPPAVTEQEVIRTHTLANQDGPIGRGGLGNLGSRSRSRSRGPSSIPTTNPTIFHSTGRGGVGNIIPTDGNDASIIDKDGEPERQGVNLSPFPTLHSVGRGGLANIVSGPEPIPEDVVHIPGEYSSTGRGGAGNVIHNN